jgi:hypothetical protein
MLIRISLIVAIIAGLAAGILGFVQVRERLVTTMDERDQYHRESIYERGEKEKAQTELAQTQEELDITQKNLARSQSELQTMTAQFQQEQERVSQLTANLNERIAELRAAQQEIERWRLTGLTPEQIKTLASERDRAREEVAVLTDELDILTRAKQAVDTQLDILLGRFTRPVLPQGLRGEVVAVDPKYDFVVLNVGSNHGVVEHGELLVNRDGQLVGRLRVASVEPSMSIANVMPGWRNGEIVEGDQVLP